jgi:hypothetical protein
MRTMRCFGVVAMLTLMSVPALADVRYETETQVKFNGALGTIMKLAGGSKPVVTTVSLKGDRLRTDNAKTSQIIDLDKGVFIDIDHDKKQYTVMTFEDMRQRMEKAMAEMHEEANSQPPREAAPQEAPPEVHFKAKIEPTGKTQTIDGHETEGVLLTLTAEGQDSTGAKGSMTVTSEMWMAKDLQGYAELQEFRRRLGEKLGKEWFGSGRLWDSLASSSPELANGLRDLQTESRKVEGTPLLTTTRVDGAVEEPQTGETTSQPAEKKKEDEGTSLEKPSVTGMLGHFGKKKVEEHEKKQEEDKAARGEGATLMTSTTHYRSFSNEAIPGSVFDPPAGYKEVTLKD